MLRCLHWLCCILFLLPGQYSLRILSCTFRSHFRKLHPLKAAGNRISSSEVAPSSLDLAPLLDHERIGCCIGQSIALWLDTEYIVQPVHAKIGNSVDISYRNIRAGGLTDLTDVLFEMGRALEGVDMENAFVNAWDVANKASDLLLAHLRAHELTCQIRSEQVFTERTGALASNFARYRLLQGYLDGEVPYEEVHPALAALLGFRFIDSSSDGVGGRELRQDPELAPSGWDGLLSTPVFETVEDRAVYNRLVADLPEDESSLDAVLEVLMGHESYAQSKRSTDQALQRRVLIAKWMYLHGFLNVPEFPPGERYVPPHRLEPEEDGGEGAGGGATVGT